MHKSTKTLIEMHCVNRLYNNMLKCLPLASDRDKGNNIQLHCINPNQVSSQ